MLVHTVLALFIQLLVLWLCGSWFAGAWAASAWFVSREITQAEYRWIETYGHGLRANMPWWGGLDLRVWQKADPWIDWILPTVVTFALATLMHLRLRRGAPSDAAFMSRSSLPSSSGTPICPHND